MKQMQQCLQWFGDLVTAEWWDNLWLHEGQAEYWAPRGSYGIHPEQANIFVRLEIVN